MNIKKENNFFIFDHPIKFDYKYYLKFILAIVFDFFYYVILRLNTKKITKKKYDVAICAIFKNEAHNMKEWIEFHKIIGVDHFYLYNNFSNDNYLEVLNIYIDKGLVTLIDWPIEKGQMKAYEHCFANFKEECNWVSFLDLDEYIIPIKTESIKKWLEKRTIFPCILVYWKMFGTSGIIENNEQILITEQYTVSWDKLVNIGKVFWNTEFIISDYSSMHLMNAKHKVFGLNIIIPPLNQFNQFVKYGIHRHGRKTKNDIDIQINHYWSKSLKDMVIKKFARGDAFFGDTAPTRNWDSFMYHENKNTSTDHKIFKYLIQLKTALGLTSYLFKK